MQKNKTLLKGSFFLMLFFSFLFFTINEVNAQSTLERLKGKILLQVEQNGEAWYVNPQNSQRYYLGRPNDAFNVMRELGIGITNNDLKKIQVADSNLSGELDSDNDGLSDMIENSFNTNINNSDSDNDGYSDKNEILYGYDPNGIGALNIDKTFSEKQSGKILLQVEQNGEAWYVNPDNNKRYFLGRPQDAFNVMRNLGLGISDDNLNLFSINLDESSVSENFPLRKPDHKVIKEKWSFNTWLDDFEKFNSNRDFTERENQAIQEDGLSAIKKVFGEDKTEADFEMILQSSTKKGRDIELLYSLFDWANEMSKKTNSASKEYGEVFKDLLETEINEVESFLETSNVLTGVEKNTSSGDMAAAWFRLGHLHAYSTIEAGNLFTKSFRQKIYSMNISENMKFDEVLYNLFKVYYHADLKYSLDDLKTFNVVKSLYGQHITEENNQRIFDEGAGTRIIWIVEDNSWRLNDIIIE